MDLVGRYIAGRYEMLEKVGNGGMATVYKAKDRVLNRYVAVKVLKEEFTTDEEFIRRFNIEAQSAAGLTHPNIVSVYDVGEEDGIHFIVMELIQGKTLKEIIKEEGTLPWKWSVNIAIQIASALEAAHKNNIVHRDIKPHNIIITEDGIAKVTDFGIAKAVSNSTITAFGTTIGSVHYFSPEHARGGFTDAKSDLYSLGVVMYEMLTGRVPFDADTPVSIALKHMQEKPIEPMKLNPSIPFALNQIIVKAMQKDPAARYQSATEMLKDLGMALKNPEGNFVEEGTADEHYIRKLGTFSEDIDENNSKLGSHKKKKESIFKKYPKLKILVWSILLIILFIITIIITKTAMDAGTPKDTETPELLGLTLEEAKEKLQNTKFIINDDVKEAFSAEFEAGKIMLQEPKAGKVVKENSQIVLTISKGIEMTVVPKVAGETSYEAAVTKLTDAKLKAEKVGETNEKIPEGTVIKQEPEANTEIAAGETVKVYVSLGSGKEKVAVTYVIGKTEEAAKKELEGGKLAVEVVYEEDASKADGTVLRQSLGVGEVVEEGTKVILTVNKIAQIKQGTVNIKFTYPNANKNKSSSSNTTTSEKTNITTNTTTNETATQTTAVPKTHELIILVGSDQIRRTFTEGTAKMTETISGKGTVEVRIKIDGSQEGYKSINFDSENPVLDFDITVR